MGFFQDIITLLESFIVTIPTDNALGVIYVVLNLVIQLAAAFVGGDTNLPSPF